MVEPINSSFKGATYFLALENMLQAKAVDNYESRGMDLARLKAVMQKREGWMDTFRGSEHKLFAEWIRISYNYAKTITEYLVRGGLVGWKLNMLMTSWEQLRDIEVEMTHMHGKIQVMSRMSREMQVDMSRILREMKDNMRRTLYEMQVDLHRMMREMHVETRSRMLREKQADLNRIPHNQTKAAMEYLIKEEFDRLKLDMMGTNSEQLRENLVEFMLKTVDILDKKRERSTMEEVATSKTNKTTRMLDLSSQEVDHDNTTLPSTPPNRSPSPIPVPTEFPGSPLEVYTVRQKNNPFQVCEGDDEEDNSADAREENDILLADTKDQACQFSAMLNLSRREVDHDNTTLPSTPPNRSPSPIPIPTEFPGSPLEVYAARQMNNPFQVCEDEDEEDSSADSGEENDILLADNRDQSCQFSAMLDEVDVATGFQSLFTAVKKKTVYIHDIDEALARCGVILLSKKGTELQTLHFGETTLVKMREKALAKWQNAEATAGQNQVRAWLGTLKDHGDDREKSCKHILENAPSNDVYQKLWAYLVNAIVVFPKSDSSKVYSESTAISSYILPLCRAFMSMPNKSVFMNFIDATTVSGRLRNGSSSRKEPDLALEIKDSTNKTICEVGIGEVTSHAQKCNKKKNAKDLVRVGHSLKDALDFIQDEYSVHDTVLVGWQVIGQTMAIYLMFKCGNLYIMVHARDVTIPDNLTELGTISTQFKIWNDLRATVEEGLNSVLEAVVSGKGKGRVIGAVGPVGSVHARIETTRTPEFKTFLNRV